MYRACKKRTFAIKKAVFSIGNWNTQKANCTIVVTKVTSLETNLTEVKMISKFTNVLIKAESVAVGKIFPTKRRHLDSWCNTECQQALA